MPELPEVQTVVDGLNNKIIGKKIIKIWTDYESSYYKGKKNIKDKSYFREFKKNILGSKILKVKRRAKNIIIYLDNKNIILVHLKMTGHFLYGKYYFDKETSSYYPKGGFVSRDDLKKDKSGDLLSEIEHFPLRDPFNKFIHFVLEFDDGNSLALSDMRKFASISYYKEDELEEIFKNIGPEPFDINVDELFKKIKLNKYKNKAIKTVLMNPEFISGIGNIYSDEILWEVGIHPEKKAGKITKKELVDILKFSEIILKESIAVGGDSMSDFRNVEGRKGKFQVFQKVYKKEGTICEKKKCNGIIEKKLINGRVARYCQKHQKK